MSFIERMMADNKDPNVPPEMVLIRKVSRWLAGFWLVLAAIMLMAAISDVIEDPDNVDAWLFVIVALAMCLPAYPIWRVTDWFIKKRQAIFSQALNDPSKEIQTVKVTAGSSTFEHTEITDKGSREKYVTEDTQGRVIFDSTQRPIRLMFGGAFLVTGLIIGGLIFTFSDDVGFFEYFFVGGWVAFCLVAMGYVYEVTIIKHLGIVDRKAGWFVFVRKRRFNLTDFSRVVVESTFYRQRHDMVRDNYRSEDPKFHVNLTGRQELNLRVFSSLSDARHMGEDVAFYLRMPLEEKSEVTL